MSLCPEAEYRASAEFWEHVFHGDDGPDDYDPADDPNAPLVALLATPCEVCGSLDEACSYDTEGRPLIHATPIDEETA